MATNKIKTEKKGAKTAKGSDPFATTVEPASEQATPIKPQRPIKVIKGAKLINAASGVSNAAPKAQPAPDAFAEVAAPDPRSAKLNLDPPTQTSPVKKTRSTSQTKAVEALRSKSGDS